MHMVTIGVLLKHPGHFLVRGLHDSHATTFCLIDKKLNNLGKECDFVPLWGDLLEVRYKNQIGKSRTIKQLHLSQISVIIC